MISSRVVVLIFVHILFIVGCNNEQDTKSSTAPDPEWAAKNAAYVEEQKRIFSENQQIPLIESAVKESLIDPDSARFGATIVRTENACVSVNARNKFGGYTGEQCVYVTKIDGKWVSIGNGSSGDLSCEICLRMLDR